jgi:hypothetical protein
MSNCKDEKVFPYVTFSLDNFLSKQSDFVDLLVPELGLVSVPNISNVNNLDLMLDSLEKSPLISNGRTNYDQLCIPSVLILRVLFTLSTTIFPTHHVPIYGLYDFDQDSKQSSLQTYKSTLDKPPLSVRSVRLLSHFVNYINQYKEENPAKVLDERFRQMMLDFASFSLQNPSKPKNRNRVQSSLDHFSEKKTEPLQHFTFADDEDTMVVSDSEDEPPILTSFEQREQELAKYQHHIPSHSFATTLLPSESAIKSPVLIQDIKWKWYEVKVFDEFLLSRRLNPELSKYNIWYLINWMFHCADKAGEYDTIPNNSSVCFSHTIYLNYRDLLDIVFEYLTVDFWKMQSQPDDSLLDLVVRQLSSLDSNWYDRAVEYTFNGLQADNSGYEPKSCSQKEHNLLKLDSRVIKKMALSNSAVNLPSSYNDRLDSMHLRFKIMALLYNRSKFIDEEPQTSTVLVNEIARKFIKIDWIYIQEFYDAAMDQPQGNLRRGALEFLNDLSLALLWNLVPVVDEDYDIEIDVEKIDYNCCYNLLDKISLCTLYDVIVEDENIKGLAEFNSVWLKVNFVLQWLLNLCLTENNTPYTVDELKILRRKCAAGDKVRQTMFDEKVKRQYAKQWMNYEQLFDYVYGNDA